MSLRADCLFWSDAEGFSGHSCGVRVISRLSSSDLRLGAPPEPSSPLLRNRLAESRSCSPYRTLDYNRFGTGDVHPLPRMHPVTLAVLAPPPIDANASAQGCRSVPSEELFSFSIERFLAFSQLLSCGSRSLLKSTFGERIAASWLRSGVIRLRPRVGLARFPVLDSLSGPSKVLAAKGFFRPARLASRNPHFSLPYSACELSSFCNAALVYGPPPLLHVSSFCPLMAVPRDTMYTDRRNPGRGTLPGFTLFGRVLATVSSSTFCVNHRLTSNAPSAFAKRQPGFSSRCASDGFRITSPRFNLPGYPKFEGQHGCLTYLPIGQHATE